MDAHHWKRHKRVHATTSSCVSMYHIVVYEHAHPAGRMVKEDWAKQVKACRFWVDVRVFEQYLTRYATDKFDGDSVVVVVFYKREEVGSHGLEHHANMSTVRSNVLEMIHQADHMLRAGPKGTARLSTDSQTCKSRPSRS